MEIIMISENKLKVMLTAEDLRDFELSSDTLDYSNTETKRMFWDILDRAKHTSGFNTDGRRVLVQIYPSRCGGCEMFVTRLGFLCGAARESEESADSEPIISQLPPKEKKREATVTVFAFESIGSLISVCKRLSLIGYDGESEAYVGEDKRSYLFLTELDTCPYLPLDEYSFISEYGTHQSTELARTYVGEHARRICASDAVRTLASF